VISSILTTLTGPHLKPCEATKGLRTDSKGLKNKQLLVVAFAVGGAKPLQVGRGFARRGAKPRRAACYISDGFQVFFHNQI
jgi:hypothetical protein